MRLCRSIAKRNRYIALVASVVLLLYLVLTPPAYNYYKSVTVFGSDVQDIGITKHIALLTALLSESESLSDVVTYHIINRNQQSARLLPNLIFYALAVLLAGYGILIHICKSMKQQRDQSTSELAFSKGGHAPPLFF